MHHCLSKEELKQLIDARISEAAIDDELLRIWVSNAESWMDELGGLNYFLSQILERAKKLGESCEGIIDVFYVLDTTSLISHFKHVFSRPSAISQRAHGLIDVALRPGPQNVQLSIPAVVF